MNNDRRRPRRPGALRGHRHDSARHQRACARCNTPIGQVAYASLGLSILVLSRSDCRWGSDSDAAAPGILGPGRLPHLLRSDYVTNSNDSYWLNPEAPLEGYARIIGDERTARSLRARGSLIMTRQQIEAGGFTRRAMQRMVFSNRQYAGELTGRRAGGRVPQPVWRHGTHLGRPASRDRQCLRRARGLGPAREPRLARRDPLPPLHRPRVGAADLWSTPFTVSDPVNTPNTSTAGSACVALQRCDLRPERRRHRARSPSSATCRCHSRRSAHSGPRGARRSARAVQRDLRVVRRRLRLPRRRARLLLRAGGHLEPGPLPGRGHDPHLLQSENPRRGITAIRRGLPQALGARALRRRDVLAGTRSTTVAPCRRR